MTAQRSVLVSLLAVWLASALLLGAAPLSNAQGQSQAEAQIGQAYAAVLGAEQSGGNVTALVAKLNTAISYAQQAGQIEASNPAQAQSLYAQASSLASQVIQAAPGVASAGKAAVFAAQVDLVIETAVVAELAVVAYLYVPRLFWRLWIRAHRDWRVRRS